MKLKEKKDEYKSVCVAACSGGVSSALAPQDKAGDQGCSAVVTVVNLLCFAVVLFLRDQSVWAVCGQSFLYLVWSGHGGLHCGWAALLCLWFDLL